MIQVALRALAEEGGSTAAGISRRIAAVYLDLPWAHERLLPHYLHRLVAAGDVAVASPGRYALLSPSPIPVGAANPNPSPCPRSTPVAVHPDGPAAAAAPTPRSSSSATAAVVDSGPGEGLGARTPTIAVAAAFSGGDGEGQCDHSSMPATAVSHGGDEERPSVPDLTSATAFVVQKNERAFVLDRRSGTTPGRHPFFLESKSSGKRGRGRPPLRRRGRGRPPYSAKYHWEPASATHVSDPGVGGYLHPKCGRGRPPDSFIESLPTFKPSVLPRRGRGRPPKCKPTVVTSDAVSADDDIHLLNSASSHDRKHMELDRDAYLSLSLADGTSSGGAKLLSNGSAAPRLRVILRLPRKPERSLADDSSTPHLSLLGDQVAVHVPKRPRTSIDHKPRKISTTLFEERLSNGPLIQSSEQMVCALPASVQDFSPNNIVSSRPRIEGWVQVLLAGQPMAANVQQAKKKKGRPHCNERKLVHPTDQFRPDSFLLIRKVENVAQMDAWLQTPMTKQSNTVDLLQAKVDENRAHIERCIQLISALTLDPNGSFQTTEEENLPHVDRGAESMSTAPFQAMEEENGAHNAEGRQTLPVDYSVRDSSLQTGKEECRTHAGGCIESLPSEQFTHADSLQISMENVANMEGSTQLLATGLSKTEDGLQREARIRLHAEVYASELPEKQLVNKELENEPQDEGSIQELPVERSRPEDDLQALVNESYSKRCLQALPKFGDDLQTEVMSEPLSVEFLLECTAEQYALRDSLQSQELGNRPQVEESVQELYVQHSKSLNDLQSEQEDESDDGDHVKVLPHEQAKLQDDLRFEKDENGAHALGCTIKFSAKACSNFDSSWMHQLQEGSHDELFNRELSAEQKSPEDELQIEDSNRLCAEKYVLVLHEEQPKLGVDLLSEADENGGYAEGYVPALLEKGPIHGDSFQARELEKRPQDEGFTQEIPIDPYPIEDDLQRKDHVESHADEGLQVFLQVQHKPGDDLQTEDSRTHAEGLILQLPLEKSMVCDYMQMSESENSTQTGESIQDPPSKLSKPEYPLLTEETNELHNNCFLQGPGPEQLETYYPLQSKGEKNVPLKKNKKRARRLWFEG